MPDPRPLSPGSRRVIAARIVANRGRPPEAFWVWAQAMWTQQDFDDYEEELRLAQADDTRTDPSWLPDLEDDALDR